MTNKEHIERLQKQLGRDLVDAAYYMDTTMGFPVEMFEATMVERKMNMLDQLCFVASMRKRYPKAFRPMVI